MFALSHVIHDDLLVVV